MGVLGQDFGGGPTVKLVELTPTAAQFVRERAEATGRVTGARYTKAAANETTSNLLELLATGQTMEVIVSDAIIAAVGDLRRLATELEPPAQNGVLQLVAAIRAAYSLRGGDGEA